MARLPQKTAAPDSASVFSPTTAAPTMSSTTPSSSTAGPAPTPLPPGVNHAKAPVAENDVEDEEAKAFKLPKLRLIIEDLSHPGALRFLAASNPSSIFEKAVRTVIHQLYQVHPKSIPGTRSVTLYLEDMDGVAYTKGSNLDNDHKEIHFSLGYIANIRKAPDGANGDVTGKYEIAGVLTHELVHCYQHNGLGTANGGLIEGIADWVRLRAHLGATHWRRTNIPDRWDAGYEKTAFFLDWLETHKFGEGAVRRINERLKAKKYVEDKFWTGLFGASIDSLFKDYVRHLKPGH